MEKLLVLPTEKVSISAMLSFLKAQFFSELGASNWIEILARTFPL